MRSICFFSSYYTTPAIPEYVKFYLTELGRHFSEVVFLTTEKTILAEDLEFLKGKNIAYRLYKNEGFDFGMWYKAFKEYNVIEYDRIGLVNDSCILFNKLDFYFDWLNKNDIDYSGLVDCTLISYHIQSYFVVINKKAILPTLKYFEMNGIISDFTQLIKTYEVKLCTYLMDAGIKLAAYYSFKDIPGIGNPSWQKAKSLIRDGFPLIKKKIIIRYYGPANWISLVVNGFDPYPNHYIRLIKATNPPVSFEKLLSDLPIHKPLKDEIKFYIVAVLSQMYGLFKRAVVFIIKEPYRAIKYRSKG